MRCLRMSSDMTIRLPVPSLTLIAGFLLFFSSHLLHLLSILWIKKRSSSYEKRWLYYFATYYPARENRHDDGVDVSKEIDRSNIPAVLSADVNSPM